MNTLFLVQGTNNVVDMFKYRKFRDIKALFTGWKSRLLKMHPDEIALERYKLTKELELYPDNTMTAAKKQIFENATGTKL